MEGYSTRRAHHALGQAGAQDQGEGSLFLCRMWESAYPDVQALW